MNRAMLAAASGMAAQQAALETVADNLANVDVTGFTTARATFSEVRDGTTGLGVALAGREPVFAQGKLVASNGPCDLAIDGPGFFCVERDGVQGFTRDGAFARDPSGALRNAAGWRLRGIRVPADALALHVGADGRVAIDRPGSRDVTIGRIRLATFAAPERLAPRGATVFLATPRSGPAHLVTPSERGPALVPGHLERPALTIVEAMMQILAAQRAYEANAKGVQAADEMQRIASNLHRG